MIKGIKKEAEKFWWLLLITGILSVLFGLVAILWPGVTLVALIYLFSFFLIGNGLIELFYSLSSFYYDEFWWFAFFIGIALIIVGVFLALHPALGAAVFVMVVSCTLIVRGIYDLVIGISLAFRKELWIISGILNILAGILIWLYPVSGSLAFAWVVGLYAFINGILVISGATAAKKAYRALITKL